MPILTVVRLDYAAFQGPGVCQNHYRGLSFDINTDEEAQQPSPSPSTLASPRILVL